MTTPPSVGVGDLSWACRRTTALVLPPCPDMPKSPEEEEEEDSEDEEAAAVATKNSNQKGRAKGKGKKVRAVGGEGRGTRA